MAEALGFAASIISVASLAIQLGDSVRKAWKFAESIEDGPEDIRRVSADLRWLANYLSTLGDEFETGDGDRVQEMLAKEALETIKGDIDSLATLVAELSSKIAPHQRTWKRKWAKVQTVLKESKIAKMREYIHNAIRNLQLLQTSRLQSSLLQMNGKLHLLTAKFNTDTRTDVESTSQSIPSPSLLIEESSIQQIDCLDQSTEQTLALAPNPKNMRMLTTTAIQSIDAGLGVLTFRTTSSTFIKSSTDDKDQRTIVKGKKFFTVNLIFRLLSCRRGFSVNTNETFDSWTFNTIRKRPDQSPIFLKSEQGDLHGVQELILSGQASVFDIDTKGWTPLHYACRFGRSELVKFLVSKGADIFMRSEYGTSPVDELYRYDVQVRDKKRRDVALIVNVLLQDAHLDAFSCKNNTYSTDSFALHRGLPYEILQILLTEDIKYVNLEDAYNLVYDNLNFIDKLTPDYLKSLTLLLKTYDTLRSDNNYGRWPFLETFLQLYISYWSIGTQVNLLGLDTDEGFYELIILKFLELTQDLYRHSSLGTALDIVARLIPEKIPRFLELLVESGADLHQYLAYEKMKHPDGMGFQGRYLCCRDIKLTFLEANDEVKEREESQEEVEGQANLPVRILVENICQPRYSHLDSQYRCEAMRLRRDCISKLDESLVDEHGRPRKGLPGCWDSPLKPNKELWLVYRSYFRGSEYVDVPGADDLVIMEPCGDVDERASEYI